MPDFSELSSEANEPVKIDRPANLLAFAELHPFWTPAAHLLLLLQHLEALKRREIHKLMIEMPPRHGKSTTVGEIFAPWWLLESPDDRVVYTSYEANFARTWGRKARAVVQQFGPYGYDLQVKSNTDAANDWELEGHRGGFFTTGIGGPITGRGFDLGIIDDPVKNEAEAHSEVIQQRNIDWYRSTFSTRREPNAVECFIGTRWHEADLAGRILADEAHEWTVLCLPAIAEPGDTLKRRPGDPLWAERYNRDALDDIRYGKVDPETRKRRGGIGTYFWNALYQQRPSSAEGNIFKRAWWRYYDQLPAEPVSSYTIVDTAGYDDKTTGDYAVITTVSRVGRDLYWRDVQRGHWEFPDLVQRILDTRGEYGYPILVEETPWAKPLIQTLKQRVNGVIAFKIEGKSKLTRAQSVSPFVEGGNCYLPNGASWLKDFVDEHAAFPEGAHDDMVDTTSMAGLRLLLGDPVRGANITSEGLRYRPQAPRPLGPVAPQQQRRVGRL